MFRMSAIKGQFLYIMHIWRERQENSWRFLLIRGMFLADSIRAVLIPKLINLEILICQPRWYGMGTL
jgi:hypothetical protein